MSSEVGVWDDTELVKRFNARVQKQDSGCWIWTGARSFDGYGRLTVRRKALRANRFAWVLANRQEIPSGLFACHACDNPSCVNPAHIWLGTAAENLADCRSKGRGNPKNPPPPFFSRPKSSCKQGHAMTPENTRWDSKGHRKCAACAMAWTRAWRLRKAAERKQVRSA